MASPKDLYFYKEHEWIKQDPDGTVLVGISDFAQHMLTDIVYAGLKVRVGDKINFGQIIGEVESVKSVSDIYTPISGEVVSIKNILSDSPENINTKPYESWFLKVKPANLKEELTKLMNAEAYDKYCSTL